MNRIGLLQKCLIGLIFMISTLTLSLQAHAATSCTALLTDLSQYLYYPPNNVTIIHMTNYQANGQWWGGWTQTQLYRGMNGHLVGTGNRLISNRLENLGGGGFGQMQPFSIRQPEWISYDIDLDGRIILDGQYGPYQMTCEGNKFAFFNSGDSLENFSFSKGTGPF